MRNAIICDGTADIRQRCCMGGKDDPRAPCLNARISPLNPSSPSSTPSYLFIVAGYGE